MLWLADLISGSFCNSFPLREGEKRPMKVESRSEMGEERWIVGSEVEEGSFSEGCLRFCAMCFWI